MRRLHLILTIGGGFLGMVVTLQAFVAAKESNPLFYAMLAAFVALYGYGVFAGLRLAEHEEEKKHLMVFYWLQVPWISSPIIAYHFASGFHVSGGFMDWKLSGLFRIGSDWQFSLFQSAPWGLGVNAFALVMAILLLKKEPNQALEPTSTAVTPSPAGKPSAGRLRRATPGEPAGDRASGPRGCYEETIVKREARSLLGFHV